VIMTKDPQSLTSVHVRLDRRTYALLQLVFGRK
jgi:hypothetical protein